MTHGFIHVRPAARKRVAFARWAVAQRPKVRTVSQSEFGVPPALFVDMPEGILRDSLVDGRPYISPLDHEEETEAAGPGAPELLGVATRGPDGFLEAIPGQPLPEVPASAYLPDSHPLPDDSVPLDDADGEGELSGVLVGETGPETVVPLRDTGGDTPRGVLTPGGDTAEETPSVTSEDTPGDTGDTTGDTGGDTSRPFRCGACPSAFKSERGRDSHRRQVHGR